MNNILRLCSTCKRLIFFAATTNGRSMPINAFPVVRAEADCYLDTVDGADVVVMITEAERDHPRDSVARTLFRTHWQDCTDLTRHRNPR